jgi:hypothetical protein
LTEWMTCRYESLHYSFMRKARRRASNLMKWLLGWMRLERTWRRLENR